MTLNSNQFLPSQFCSSTISAGLSWVVLLLFSEGLLMRLWSVPCQLGGSAGGGSCSRMVSLTFLACGSLSAGVKGMHGPWVSHHPPNPSFFILLAASCLKSSKRGQTPVCKRFSNLCLLHSCHSPAGQRELHLQHQRQCGRRCRHPCTNCSCYCNRLLLQQFIKWPCSSLGKFWTLDNT